MIIEETILEKCKAIEVKILEVDIEGIIEMIILKEVEVGLGIDNIQVISADMIEAIEVGLDQHLDLVQIDRIGCFKCREYNHFAKECPNLQTEKEPEKVQQVYTFDEEQTTLKLWQQICMTILLEQTQITL